MENDLAEVLHRFYQQSMETSQDELQYMGLHSSPAYINNAVQTFRFYEPYVPSGRILDWGCRHAPEAYMIKVSRGDSVELHGCDVFAPGLHLSLHGLAGIEYRQLRHPFLLPYNDAMFDAVVGSGVIEHVPFDSESMKELYRILKPNGRLMLTWVPNALSFQEWQLRRSGQANIFHWRLYSKSQLRNLLLHYGFRPLVVGFQDRLDVLPIDGPDYRVSGRALRIIRPFVRTLGLHRIVGGLCAVGEKVESV
jgi:SAM-dependent methyltransferase